MSMKLIALGNVLMGDDGIAIRVAGLLEAELAVMGIDVIYGETDIGYCITQVREEDYLILLDAARLGKRPGELSLLPFNASNSDETGISQHGISFIDLLEFYYPYAEGVILAVEIADIQFRYGISTILMDRIQRIANEVLDHIKNIEKQHTSADL